MEDPEKVKAEIEELERIITIKRGEIEREEKLIEVKKRELEYFKGKRRRLIDRAVEHWRRAREYQRRGWVRKAKEEFSEWGKLLARVRTEVLPAIRSIRGDLISEGKELAKKRRELERKLKELEEKRKLIKQLKRVETALYIIIEGGEKTYKTGIRLYPKGRFQAWFQHDAWVDLTTNEVIKDEFYKEIIEKLKAYFIIELSEWFFVVYSVDDVTVGESSVIPDQSDLGKPPKKVRLERLVDKPVPKGYHPRSDWQMTLEEWLG